MHFSFVHLLMYHERCGRICNILTCSSVPDQKEKGMVDYDLWIQHCHSANGNHSWKKENIGNMLNIAAHSLALHDRHL